MKILITGKDGLVGNAACRIYRELGDNVVGFSKSDFNIADSSRALEILEQERPNVLLNCAAFTDVDGAEDNQELNDLVNATAPAALAETCRDLGIYFVTISTDYVFDGRFDGFYVESHLPNPLSKYGVAKLRGENSVLEKSPQAMVVRTGWVFGKGGTNFLCVVPELIKEKKEFFAIKDSFGTPTFADDLVLKIRELIDVRANGLFHLSNSGSGTSYDGFAKTCAEFLGIRNSNRKRVSEANLERAANRPTNSRMKSERLSKFGVEPLRNWKDAVKDFVSVS